ncbi:MAG: hypothetical protein ACK52I_23525 [Pseudomonadota bacterium]
MSRADEKTDVDPEVAGLVAFHRGRAAGHRRAFLDSMDLLQGAAARAADAEAELAELRAEVSALRQRLQNDSQGHRVQLQHLQRQLGDSEAERTQHKAKVQQLLDEQQAARDDLAALHCSLDQAGAPQADGPQLLTLVRRVDWLAQKLREVEGQRRDLARELPTSFAASPPFEARFLFAIKNLAHGNSLSGWAKDADDLRNMLGTTFLDATGKALLHYTTGEELALLRRDKEAAELARVEAERERDEAVTRAEGAEAELREIKRTPGDADQETNSTAGPGPGVCR